MSIGWVGFHSSRAHGFERPAPARTVYGRPVLVRRYERLYADGAYAPKWYQRRITGQVHELAQEYGIGPTRPGMPRRSHRPEPEPVAAEPTATGPTQLSLL
ncbi:hypothetical protein ACWEWI_39295 [Streptomyces sp. NPDC003753]